jgi:hypothetical protein
MLQKCVFVVSKLYGYSLQPVDPVFYYLQPWLRVLMTWCTKRTPNKEAMLTYMSLAFCDMFLLSCDKCLFYRSLVSAFYPKLMLIHIVWMPTHVWWHISVPSPHPHLSCGTELPFLEEARALVVRIYPTCSIQCRVMYDSRRFVDLLPLLYKQIWLYWIVCVLVHVPLPSVTFKQMYGFRETWYDHHAPPPL